MLLAQKGVRVLIHGGNSESTRVSCEQVIKALGWPCADQPITLLTEPVTYVPLSLLCPGLWRLLQVRREIGLRNSGHSMVKLMNPVQGACVQVASYTHPNARSPVQSCSGLGVAAGGEVSAAKARSEVSSRFMAG